MQHDIYKSRHQGPNVNESLQKKKQLLVSQLRGYIPDNRMKFWEGLPINKSDAEEEL